MSVGTTATTTGPASAATPPSASPPSASQPSLVRGPVPRVLADCVSAPPHRLSVRPASIALACADNGWGVESVTWTGWMASAAMGQGTFWEKLCQPNCASGKIGTYPVLVTLSVVKTSSQGPWFSRLTVTWRATQPPNPTPDSFPLMPPQY